MLSFFIYHFCVSQLFILLFCECPSCLFHCCSYNSLCLCPWSPSPGPPDPNTGPLLRASPSLCSLSCSYKCAAQNCYDHQPAPTMLILKHARYVTDEASGKEAHEPMITVALENPFRRGNKNFVTAKGARCSCFASCGIAAKI